MGKTRLGKKAIHLLKDYKGSPRAILSEWLLPRYVHKFHNIAQLISPKFYNIAIEPTNYCNLRCKTCYSQSPGIYPTRKKGYMDYKLYTKIIDELSPIKNNINLGLNFGGESLLHKKFIDMLYYATKSNFSIGFNTNGMLLTDKIINSLVSLKIDHLTISLDGLDSTHELIRKGSNYNTVKNNILQLIERRGELDKPTILVNLTQSEQTKNEIKNFVNFWVDKVDYVDIYPCLSEKIRVIKPEYFNDNDIYLEKFCFWPFSYFAVLWDGEVTACCHDINGINVLGNVNNDSVMKIWTGNAYKNLRYAAITNKFSKASICYDCNVWKKRFISIIKDMGDIKITYSGLRKRFEMKKKEKDVR